ncbi:MAG: nitroreductase family protein [Thermoleophilia bacterium]|nr:nitroreductase family protein [Thermoleophilia bacterium]
MGNWDDLGPARTYHERTKHSLASVRGGGRRLDWHNRPRPFKEYVGLEPEPPPDDLEPLLRLGAGVVRTRELPGGERYHFRTYASAGALYPVEAYVVDAGGVFHLHPGELALRRLREGDWRASLGEPDARAVLVLTGILWRTAWKYGARGYRHLFWDAGTMLANLLALAEEPRLHTGFVDARVNRLVGVDGRREAALALLAVGRAPRGGAPQDEPPPLALATEPLSRREEEFLLADALHAASTLASDEEGARYRDRVPEQAPAGELAPEPPPADDLFAGRPLAKVIRRRGSARHFTSDSLPEDELAAILAAADAPINADTQAVTETYVFANAVAGLAPGLYRYRAAEGWDCVRTGSFRARAGYLALEQEHAARAAATQCLLADLDAVLEARGNRGYRWANLEAGIRAGRMYLGATARDLGATGLTFYDDETAAFLAGGTRQQPLLCLALGPDARTRARARAREKGEAGRAPREGGARRAP